jgi:hypothetical protein
MLVRTPYGVQIPRLDVGFEGASSFGRLPSQSSVQAKDAANPYVCRPASAIVVSSGRVLRRLIIRVRRIIPTSIPRSGTLPVPRGRPSVIPAGGPKWSGVGRAPMARSDASPSDKSGGRPHRRPQAVNDVDCRHQQRCFANLIHPSQALTLACSRLPL